MRVIGTWMLTAAFVAASLTAGGPASAEASGAGSTISGPALPEDCQRRRSESFPQLAVHPDDPSRLSATFLSDGAAAVGYAFSTDGGTSWQRSALGPANRCTGGSSRYAYNFNPQLSAGPDGTAYFGNSWLNGVEEHMFEYGVAAHGLDTVTWSDGTSPGGGDYAQNLALVPDPLQPGLVTAVWTHMDQVPVWNYGPVFYAYATSEVLAAVSTDGARTFGTPSLVAAEPGRIIVNVRAERTSEGALLAVYDSIDLTDLPRGITRDIDGVAFRQRAVRSTDGGATWSLPSDIGDRHLLVHSDPDGRTWHRGQGAGSIKFHLATGPGGRSAVVWAERVEGDTVAIRLATSDDDGRSWATPRTVLEREGAFQPAVAIDGTGSLGIVFYDWSRDRLGDEPLTTDVWLATQRKNGTWQVRHIDGWFDLRAAWEEGLEYDGYAIGVYQDIVGFPRGFGAAYTVASPLASDGHTDVRFARAGG